MQSENKLFDDFVKFVNGAAGTLAGMGREAESSVRERAREWMGGLDFVSREEFETVKAIALEARAEVEKFREELTGKIPGKGATKPSSDVGGPPDA